MSLQLINIGANANDGSGDPLRLAFQKVNNNFTQLYTNLGNGAAPPDQAVQFRGTNSLLTVAYGNNAWVAFGDPLRYYKSTDGSFWSSETSPVQYPIYSVVATATGFIAVGGNGTIVTSGDAGTTWAVQTSGTTNTLRGVFYDSATLTYVAVGDSGTILTSANAVNWTTQASGIATALYGVTRTTGSAGYVAVGAGGKILTSSNGTSWSTQTSGISTTLLAVTYDGTRYVATGAGGVILYSSNGVNWVARSSGTTESLNSVSYGNIANVATLVAVGANGTTLVSTDGNAATWTSQSIGTTSTLSAVTYANVAGNAYFYTAGLQGAIFSTANANGWTNVSVTGTFTGDANFIYDSVTQTLSVPIVSSSNLVANITTANIVAANQVIAYQNANLGSVSNIYISGGSANTVLTTNGNGVLSWQLPTQLATIPAMYFTASTTGNNQTFSNTWLSTYTSNTAITLFYNGSLLDPSFYTLSGNTLTVNTPLYSGDTIDLIQQFINVGNVSYSNSNVANYLPTYTGNLGNVNIITASGNILGANLLTTGVVTSTGNISGGNLRTGGAISATGNVTAGNVSANAYTGCSVSVTGNIAGNVITGAIVSTTGNITGNNVSAMGNVSGNYIIGNGAYLTGLPTNSYSNANVANYLPTYTGNLGNVCSITAAANITANYFFGNGACLTGLSTSSITNGNSNVVVAANSNVTIGVGGTANVAVFSNTAVAVAGNLSAANVYANSGKVEASLLTGKLTTPVQSNITGVGTLSNLSVSGNIATNSNIFANIGTVKASLLTGTLTTSAQPNITEVGTLANLSVTGNITANANVVVTGNVSANLLTGTLTTALQPNITCVGTLGNLSVTGAINAGNVWANSGTVRGSLVTGVLTTAGQPNVTGVGTLSCLSVSGNATVGNISATNHSGGQVSVTGNITGGNITTAGTISATGNICSNAYFIGNGALLSGITVCTSCLYNGNSSVNIPTANGNIVMTSCGVTALTVSSSGLTVPSNANITGVVQACQINISGNIYAGSAQIALLGSCVTANNYSGTLTTGAQPNITSLGTLTALSVTGNTTLWCTLTLLGTASAVGNICAGNFVTTGLISATGNVNSGNLNTGAISATGNILAGNVNTNIVSATGNVQGLNLRTAGCVSATGNITGNFYFGNGSQLVGICVPALVNGNSNICALANGNIAVSVGGTANVAVFSTTGEYVTGDVSATGNICATTLTGLMTTAVQPNITTLGSLCYLSVVGNVTAGNVSGTNLTGTLATAAQPNVTSVGNLTSLSVVGNTNSGNLLVSGLISSAGNITGANLVGPHANGNSNISIACNSCITMYVCGCIAGKLTDVVGGQGALSLGFQAAATSQGVGAVAVGYGAGCSSQGCNSVAIGTAAAQTSQGVNAVAIGRTAGCANQSNNAVAIGYNAAVANQGCGAVALGSQAQFCSSGNFSVAIGQQAAQTGQGNYSIALGMFSAANAQSSCAVAIGYLSALCAQGNLAIAIGYQAGQCTQGNNSVAIGTCAGANLQGIGAVAIGCNSGICSQGNGAVAIGFCAGGNAQSAGAIAIGANAGVCNQSTFTTAIGQCAQNTNAAQYATAVGFMAGGSGQGLSGTAVGVCAGAVSQAPQAVAIGSSAGLCNQCSFSIAIGTQAGANSHGNNAIAIGAYSTNGATCACSIVINASNACITTTGAGLFAAPLRNDTGNVGCVAFYNTTSKEITYANTISVAGNITGGNFRTPGCISAIGNITAGYVFANVCGNISGCLTVPGSNTQLIYNSNGNAGASANLTFNSDTDILTVTGNLITSNANLGNAATANYLTGTLTTNAQPNVTSVGSLTSLSVIGNIDAGNITATNHTGTQFSASGNITAANVLSNTYIGTGVSISSTGTITISATGNINASGSVVNNIGTPVQNTDAATKAYVDAVAQGLSIKNSVYLATTSTIFPYTYNNCNSGVGATLTAAANGALSIDSVAVAANERILVKDEAGAFVNNITQSAAFNGIYVVTQTGNSTAPYILTRSNDMDLNTEVKGAFVFVTEGATNDNTGWVNTNDGTVTLGTTSINFTQFSGAGTYTAGDGLTLTGTQFSVNVDEITTTITAGNVVVKTGAQLTTPNIGAATGTSLSVTGNITSSNADLGNLVTANYFTGTLTTNAQPNVTSVGSLTSLSVVGNIDAGNVITSLVTGTLTTNAQPNVTSVGTLTSLSSSGNITGANLLTGGSLYAAGLTLGTLANPITTVKYANATVVDGLSTVVPILEVASANVVHIDYNVSATDATSTSRQVSKIMTVYYDENVNYTEYGSLSLGDTVADFTVTYDTGNSAIVLNVDALTNDSLDCQVVAVVYYR